MLIIAVNLNGQILHSTSCNPISTSFNLDWSNETYTSGSTNQTLSNVSGSGFDVTFTVTGQTATLTTENGVATPGITNSLTGGVDGLHVSSTGLNDGEAITIDIAFTPSIAGNIAFDLYNIIDAGTPGSNVTVYAETAAGNFIIPSFTDNGTPSWNLDGPGVIDGDAPSTAGTNDQAGVNFSSFTEVTNIVIQYKRCSGCGNGADTEFAIGDIFFCLVPDTDQDGIPDPEDEDTDGDGIIDDIEKCASTTTYTFDWNNYSWAGATTQTSNTFSMPDGTTVNFEASTNGAALQSIDINANRVSGFGTTENVWEIIADQLNGSQSVDIGMGFSQALADLSFSITDVDAFAGDFTDSLIIVGYFSEFVVFPTLTASGADVVVNLNTAVGQNVANDITGNTANVLVQFNTPVDSVSIFYGNGVSAPNTPGDQAIAIYDLSYIGDCGSVDSDGDGIDDYLDIDADNDGIVDYIEWQATTGTPIQPAGSDADMDGIDDNFESVGLPFDRDGDGRPDFKDQDSDDDGQVDLLEAWDTDNNGIADILPSGIDSDGDGLDDSFDNVNGFNPTTNITNNGQTSSDFPNLEVPGTTERDWREDTDIDDDGFQDYDDIDTDNDGIADINEAANGNNPNGDEDNDGIPNWADTEDNGDGGDGSRTDYTDSNGDGIPDVYDVDGDGAPNHQELDSDNDGIPDIVEAGGTDVDNDGLVDNPTDTDNDGLADIYDGGFSLGFADLDNDGIPNHLDLDSDNDGLQDIVEAGGTDANNDGVVDGAFTDTDGDGWSNTYDSDNGGTAINYIDSDNDGNNDFVDVDSDNDGVTDVLELGGVDANGDGVADAIEDTDNDGWVNLFDSDNGGVVPVNPDSDNDGVDDRLDLDSDNDGIQDIVEAGGVDADNDGRLDGAFTDLDNDGLGDVVDPNVGFSASTFGDCSGTTTNYVHRVALNVSDVDVSGNVTITFCLRGDYGGDFEEVAFAGESGGATNFNRSNSDNPAYPDCGATAFCITTTISQANWNAWNDDRVVNLTFTPDADVNFCTDFSCLDSVGVSAPFGVSGTPLANTDTDTDNDGIDDRIDLDSDNDGIQDIIEVGGVDADNDGRVDGVFADGDTDGWSNVFDSDNGGTAPVLINTDGQGNPNYQDLDSDEDGIADIVEAGGVDANGDGLADDLTDTDQDGWVNTFDSDNGGTAHIIGDKDNDGVDNYRDLDSDNDGIADIVEAGGEAADIDGVADDLTDTDGDGLVDRFDSDNGGTSHPLTNTDGTGDPNYLDIDSDDDGIVDIIEGQNSGTILTTSGGDSDGDGIDNNFDTDNGSALITPVNVEGADDPDYIDTDSDNDGDLDILEAYDTDNDGTADIVPANSDSDNDGLDDNFDNIVGPNSTTNVTNGAQNSNSFPNLDNTGTIERDWREALPSVNDYDGDGIDNAVDIDDDNDGILDIDEGCGTPSSTIRVDINLDQDENETTWTLTDPEGTVIASGGPYVNDDELINESVTVTLGGTYTFTINDDFGDGLARTGGSNSDATSNYSITVDGVQVFLSASNFNFGAQDIQTFNVGLGLSYPTVFVSQTGVANSGNITGTPDGNVAEFYTDGDVMVVDMGSVFPAGTRYAITWNERAAQAGTAAVIIEESTDNSTFNINVSSPTTDVTTSVTSLVIAQSPFRYLRFSKNNPPSSTDFEIDAVGIGSDCLDTDGDGIEDAFDLDSDGDGIADIIEAGGVDTDGNGIVDGAFTDTDGDGWSDVFDSDNGGTALVDEDVDADGLPNRIDLDSDADGIIDLIESQRSTATPIVPSGTDSDGDGIDDNFDSNNGNVLTTPVNTYGADNPDYTDTNTDDNGDSDLIEAYDTNGDGVADTTPSGTDSDGDGIDDNFDNVIGPNNTTNITNGGQTSNTFPNDELAGTQERDWRELENVDTDLDGIIDAFDLDDDNDGILDSEERNCTSGSADLVTLDQGVANEANALGIPDGAFANVANGDVLTVDLGDLVPAGELIRIRIRRNNNARILIEGSADNVTYTGGVTYGSNGTVDVPIAVEDSLYYFTQIAGAGGARFIRFTRERGSTGVDAVQYAPQCAVVDTDNDGVENHLDLDADNDGIPDLVKVGGTDANNDARVDDLTDNDDDGIADVFDPDNGGTPLAIIDTDLDGVNDYIDADSDNDGITDNVEGQTTDDFRLPLNQDTDGDGWDDQYDSDNGGTAITLSDNEGTGGFDYLDNDADDDGVLDWIEGFDDDESGDALNDLINRADAFETAAGNPLFYINTDDTDGDGLPDWLEDADGDNIPNFLDPDNAFYQDTDNDGLVDLYDTDNGGLPSNLPDGDGDGSPDFRDVDDQISLPIVLREFTAVRIGDKVQLDWSTLTEINNDYFTIERSIDGKTFESILRHQGAGNSNTIKNYRRYDNDPAEGYNYYRLRQTDYNGDTETFNIEVVHFERKREKITLKLYPNPSTGEAVFVELSNFDIGEHIFQLFTQNGKLIKEKKVTLSNEQSRLKMEILEGMNLSSGIYNLRVISQANTKTMPFIVR